VASESQPVFNTCAESGNGTRVLRSGPLSVPQHGTRNPRLGPALPRYLSGTGRCVLSRLSTAHVLAHEIVLTFSPTLLGSDVLPLDKSNFVQALEERGYERRPLPSQRIAEAHPPFSSSRTSLLEMAQVWERLALEKTETPPLLGPIEPERPAMQQQQQVQPPVRKEEC
jgi:hypothetical protein